MMSRVRWATGDEIVIDGPCRIASTIRLVGDRSYRGESRGTVLTQAAGANLAAMLASDSWLDNASTTGLPITLRDLTIDGNRAENPMAGDGLVIRSWLTLVENLTVTNSPRDGIRVTSLSRTGTGLTNTQVNGTLRNLSSRTPAGTGSTSRTRATR